MISDEHGFTWASCDRCTFTRGVGFGGGIEEARSAFRQWGWRYEGGKVTCRDCLENKNESEEPVPGDSVEDGL